LFTDEIEKYIPPRKGKKTALRILRDILYFEPKSKRTDLNKAIEYVYRLTKKRSIIFVISDFQDSGFEDSLRLLAKKHDVIALRILDQAERELPDAGIVHLRDPESGQLVSINSSSKKLRKRYNDYLEKEDELLLEQFRKMKIDLITLFTDKPYAPELRKFFKMRIRRKNQH